MKQDNHAFAVQEVTAGERIMLNRLCAEVRSFYADPKNKSAYENWKKERLSNANHRHMRADGSQSGAP